MQIDSTTTWIGWLSYHQIGTPSSLSRVIFKSQAQAKKLINYPWEVQVQDLNKIAVKTGEDVLTIINLINNNSGNNPWRTISAL